MTKELKDIWRATMMHSVWGLEICYAGSKAGGAQRDQEKGTSDTKRTSAKFWCWGPSLSSKGKKRE